MKIEDSEQHWNDDLKTARGIFGWPLVGSIILVGLLAAILSF